MTDLSAPNMATGDPTTHITQYWPITPAQVQEANEAMLFPGGQLSNAPMTLQQLNAAFNFNPPFDPATPKMTFGHPVAAPGPEEELVRHLSDRTLLPFEQMNDLYHHNRHHFFRIRDLAGYIRNHTQGLHPEASLSVDQALALNHQETLNLDTAFGYVSNGMLTIDEVKALSEDERQIIMVQGSVGRMHASLQNLQVYRDNHAHDGVNNPGL